MEILGTFCPLDDNCVIYLDTGAKIFCRPFDEIDGIIFFGPGDENSTRGTIRKDRVIAVATYPAFATR